MIHLAVFQRHLCCIFSGNPKPFAAMPQVVYKLVTTSTKIYVITIKFFKKFIEVELESKMCNKYLPSLMSSC